MIYRIGTGLVTFALLVASLAAADDPKPDQPEPPVRLKKKEKPKAEPLPDKKPPPPKPDAKKGEGKDDEPDDGTDPGEDPKVTLERLDKNMKDSAERLAKTDSGEGTRQVQRDILKDLDSLMKQLRQRQNNQSASSSSSSSGQKSDAKQDQSASRRAQRLARAQQRAARNRQARSGQRRPENQPRDGQAQSKNSGAGGKSGGGMDRRPDAYKDVWGHLPEALRMQMDAYAREKFMAKYDELLKQYYATIAEKGRR
jgi:hypothetical protein